MDPPSAAAANINRMCTPTSVPFCHTLLPSTQTLYKFPAPVATQPQNKHLPMVPVSLLFYMD